MLALPGQESNSILARLDPGHLASLEPAEEIHETKTVLIAPLAISTKIYFPNDGAVISILRTTEDGTMIEAGIVGREGLCDVQSVITSHGIAFRNEAIVQARGSISVLELDRVREQFETNAAFRQPVLEFTSFFIDQITQNLLCNRVHPIDERLAKWLLLMSDRAGESLELTQEFLSHMLGVHRPGVSIAVNALKDEGLIAHIRNRIDILEPESLASRACECLTILRANMRGFLD